MKKPQTKNVQDSMYLVRTTPVPRKETKNGPALHKPYSPHD